MRPGQRCTGTWRCATQDPAFLLERARFALRGARDRRAAGEALLAALTGRPLRRPVFGSLPKPLQPLWLASRHARRFAPDFALEYRLFFRVLDEQAAEAERTGEPTLPLLWIRLRLAELLFGSTLYPDILSGLEEARSTLARLGRLDLSEEERATLTAYELRVDEAGQHLPPVPAGITLTPDRISTHLAGRRAPIGELTGPAMHVLPTGTAFILGSPGGRVVFDK